jgi:galacturonosyltransferase
MSDNKKKTILILANFSAGLYDFRAELLKRMVADYHVICAVPDDAKEKEIRELGCEVVFTPMNRRGMNPIEDFRLLRNYRQLIKDMKPDLVVTATVKPNIYGSIACRRLRIPYISTVTGLGSSFQAPGIVRRVVTILYRLGMKGATCLFFQNAANKEIFEQHRIRAKKSRLVSGDGVNLQTFRMEPYPAEDGFRFLFVGRIMKEKGIDEFLAAAEALHSEKIRFQILGFLEEDYQARLDQMEVRGVIDQLGFLPDVREYYREASAIVLPSYHEGMSNVLQEASATGRPIIATKVAGCREIFDEGETGFGVEKGDGESLIKALKKFMDLPESERALMGRKGREKMGKEFDREKVVAAYIQEINMVFGKDI